jgi:hypothetical protein
MTSETTEKQGAVPNNKVGQSQKQMPNIKNENLLMGFSQVTPWSEILN